MFKYEYIVPKDSIKTTYGSICIENISFTPKDIEKALPDIVFDEDNLKHIFAEQSLNLHKKSKILRRFIPKSDITINKDAFVQKCIQNNKSFYSFLAEGILGLVFRDLYDYQLAKGIIDINDTLNDSHTGVDACMYNLDKGIIVLGEAKFYESMSEGINRIINDLVKKNISNKLESLQTIVENSEEAYQIVIKNLSFDDYVELSVSKFMDQKIVFAGFVLHSEQDISKYHEPTFYDNYYISTEQLKNNICKSLDCDNITGSYEVLLVHLPINDKKSLIVKMIEDADARIKKCRGVV